MYLNFLDEVTLNYGTHFLRAKTDKWFIYLQDSNLHYIQPIEVTLANGILNSLTEAKAIRVLGHVLPESNRIILLVLQLHYSSPSLVSK